MNGVVARLGSIKGTLGAPDAGCSAANLWWCQGDAENCLGELEEYLTVYLASALTDARVESIRTARVASEANHRTQMFVGSGGANSLTQPLSNRLNTVEAHLNAHAVELRRIKSTNTELTASNKQLTHLALGLLQGTLKLPGAVGLR